MTQANAKASCPRDHAARAALQAALAAHACPCGRAAWLVTSTLGRVRYLRCARCGRTDKIVVAARR